VENLFLKKVLHVELTLHKYRPVQYLPEHTTKIPVRIMFTPDGNSSLAFPYTCGFIQTNSFIHKRFTEPYQICRDFRTVGGCRHIKEILADTIRQPDHVRPDNIVFRP